MIHAYDDARVKIDYKSADHLACSEIRAVNLSNECKSGAKKWWFSPLPEYSSCVRDRARNNVMGSPHIKPTAKEAEEAVTRVWDICFNDYDPLVPDKFTNPKQK